MSRLFNLIFIMFKFIYVILLNPGKRNLIACESLVRKHNEKKLSPQRSKILYNS